VTVDAGPTADVLSGFDRTDLDYFASGFLRPVPLRLRRVTERSSA
jgi:hypothetical protein